MSNTFSPPWTPLERLDSQLKERGFAVLGPADVSAWTGVEFDALESLRADWSDLPPDEYLKDGGNYRRRRHACFVVDGPDIRQTPPRPHWQPVEYNALHGGMQRWFAPMLEATVAQPAWHGLLKAMGRAASALRGAQPWFMEAHQFRIDTTDGIGRPTPEGAHRDGVDLVAVFLVARHGIKGGETRVFEADGPAGLRFTLSEPWSLLLLDDPRMIHESTPIQPLDGSGGWRDTLVLTCRATSFQGS